MTSVWETLSRIDCNEHVEKKGKFSYLAWTWAWAMVKENYPDATYELLPDTVFPDGTMEVRVKVVIDGMAHDMWLPVLNYQNNAIQNPNAFDINSSRMRCLVKCLAMFGLGHYIYAGESLPQSDPFTDEQKVQYLALMASEDGVGLKKFSVEVGPDVMNELFNAAPKGEKTKQKDIARRLVGEANAQLKAAVDAIQGAINDGDYSAIEEVYGEMSSLEIDFVNAALSEVQHHQIQTMREAA